jgi:hypothetical protein
VGELWPALAKANDGSAQQAATAATRGGAGDLVSMPPVPSFGGGGAPAVGQAAAGSIGKARVGDAAVLERRRAPRVLRAL